MRHQIRQAGRVVIDERQDIVYRKAVAPARSSAGSSVAAPAGQEGAGDGPPVPLAAGERAIAVSPTLLFRFSALTYNAHRIHYDRDYARDVEGYPGLLTHGPLQALLMAEAARATGPADRRDPAGLSFDYQLTSPLFDFQGLVVSAVTEPDAIVTAARDAHGRRTAVGTLRGSR